LYERAASILASLAETQDTLRDPSRLLEGEIQIAAIPTVAPYLFPRLVRAFTRKFRRAEVTMHEDFTAEIVRNCAAGEVDLGIVAWPIQDARLTVDPLFSEDLLVAIPPKHALSQKRRITLEELTRERFVLLSEIHCLGAQGRSILRAARLHSRRDVPQRSAFDRAGACGARPGRVVGSGNGRASGPEPQNCLSYSGRSQGFADSRHGMEQAPLPQPARHGSDRHDPHRKRSQSASFLRNFVRHSLDRRISRALSLRP